jgi:hypothetical protein
MAALALHQCLAERATVLRYVIRILLISFSHSLYMQGQKADKEKHSSLHIFVEHSTFSNQFSQMGRQITK